MYSQDNVHGLPVLCTLTDGDDDYIGVAVDIMDMRTGAVRTQHIAACLDVNKRFALEVTAIAAVRAAYRYEHGKEAPKAELWRGAASVTCGNWAARIDCGRLGK